MTREIVTHQIEEGGLLLAYGKRVSGDPRVEREVLTGNGQGERVSSGKGTLIPIGGGATDANLRVVTDRIGEGRGLTIITVPTQMPEQVYAEYSKRFLSVGTLEQPYHLGEHTIPEEADAMFRLSGGVFITGGDQVRARDILVANQWDKKLHDFYNANADNVISGTSAGAHVQSGVTSFNNEVTTGIGLVDTVSFESHNDKRGRNVRQRDVVEMTGVDSIGLGEGTGVIYQRSGKVEAFGQGSVNVVWQVNGHQDSKLIRDGDMVNLHALPRMHLPRHVSSI